MEERMATAIIPVETADGTIYVEADVVADAALQAGAEGLPSLDELQKTIRAVARTVSDAASGLGPDTIGLEFGLKVVAQTGGFWAVLVGKGSAEAHIKVTLEWDFSEDTTQGSD
jgi:hypothetical protein